MKNDRLDDADKIIDNSGLFHSGKPYDLIEHRRNIDKSRIRRRIMLEHVVAVALLSALILFLIL